MYRSKKRSASHFEKRINSSCDRVSRPFGHLIHIACISLLVHTTEALQPSRNSYPERSTFQPESLTRLFPREKSRSNTARRMVLTTPEAIIEQASTQKLLDDLIDESVRTSARRPIMMQFNPSSGWIWKRWKGTIFSETWDSVVTKMAYAFVVFMFCKKFPFIQDYLSGFGTLWGQLLSVTTFTLTFFVNQSYALWRKCYDLSRRLQGRLHDIDMTLAAHAVRRPPTSPNELSTYTAPARQLLELVARYVRLFNLLTYASFTRSHRPILTPRGMRRLVERGLMTAEEREILVEAELPATQRHNAILLWITRAFVEGNEAGLFLGGAGFEEQFLEKIHVTRAQYGAIGDELQGRMPLAYAHIVQVLVDLILYMYPLMAFSSGMSALLCVIGTGLLTMSYQGLFDLAKQFLDPYDNESYGKGEDPLVVDTLIAETNAGSVRWLYGLEKMPVSSQKIKDGELSDYLLPVRGYSVEELTQMEEERIQKEKELQERRQREEAERQKQLEEDARIRRAAEAMIAASYYASVSRWNPVQNATFAMVNGERREAFDMPNLLSTATISNVDSITNVVNTVASLAPALIEPLVPEGTAVARPAKPSKQKKTTGRIVQQQSPEDFRIDSTVDEEQGDENFQVNKNLTDQGNYVHTVEAFDPYKDLPCHDEIGPDGQEVRPSQMLADETWDEEVEMKQERNRIASLEEYLRRVEQVRNTTEKEFNETAAILSAAPNSETLTRFKDETNRASRYDQTNLDSISQLGGLEPENLDDLPMYAELPSEPADDANELVEFSEGKHARLGEMLTDEVLEDEETTPIESAVTFDDYTKQIAQLLEAEKEELLETEAIMNAPPGADYLDEPDFDSDKKGGEDSDKKAGEKETEEDLSILEMDVPIEEQSPRVSNETLQEQAQFNVLSAESNEKDVFHESNID